MAEIEIGMGKDGRRSYSLDELATCVLAGAGVKPGVVHGASDAAGRLPDRDAVSVADFNATIAAACGMPWEKEFVAPNGRPFKIGNDGTPVAAVLA